MKYLSVSLLLCALLSLTKSQCIPQLVRPGITHCQDGVDKTWHEVGSKWRNSKCWDCTCNGCCAAYSTPVRFPDDCVSVFDPVACQYVVHKKNDRSELCPIYGAVGK